MRSLWIRIFATFWLIQVLMIGIVTTVGRELLSRPMNPRSLEMMGFAAAEIYQIGSCEQLEQLFARFRKVDQVTPHLLDENGRAVCGDVVRQPTLDIAQRVRSSQEMAFERGGAIIAVSASVGRRHPGYVFVAETDQPPSPLLRFLRLSPPLVIFASISISGFITALLAKMLVRPIVRLRRATQELASGNLKARALTSGAKSSGGDETRALVQDFNRMAEQIESLVGAQQRLIRDISHELRSPLSRLSVAVELLREEISGPSLAHIDRIERETSRLNRLIGQLLELSRMEAMEGLGRRDTLELGEVVQEVVTNAAYEAGSRGCSVRAVIHDHISVSGNPELLFSAIENIVRNAVRYTPPGTDVLVSVERKEQGGTGKASLIVRDFGPGVPEDKLSSLCLPFYRADTARNRLTGGTGVGLAIAERAVKLHSGSLAIKNHPEGGLEVAVLIPETNASLPQASESIATSIA